MEVTKDRLKSLGLHASAKGIERAERLEHAYANYLYIPQSQVDAFNAELRKDTLKEDKNSRSYKKLNFIPIGEYQDIPPKEALDKLEKAKDDFDRFEVCKIEWHKEVKDPIIFGRIDNCSDRFYIAQWDDDIKITDFISGEYKARTSKKCGGKRKPKK